jgi:hypothetical protein
MVLLFHRDHLLQLGAETETQLPATVHVCDTKSWIVNWYSKLSALSVDSSKDRILWLISVMDQIDSDVA